MPLKTAKLLGGKDINKPIHSFEFSKENFFETIQYFRLTFSLTTEIVILLKLFREFSLIG